MVAKPGFFAVKDGKHLIVALDTFPEGGTLADIGEDELVRLVRGRLGSAEVPSASSSGGPAEGGLDGIASGVGGLGVLVGNGDDAAVLSLAGNLVVSTDTLAAEFDFRNDWSTGFEVGVKLAAQNLADIAAMGGRPVAMLVSLSAPGDLAVRWALELTEGIADECRRAGAMVVGGDVSSSKGVVLTGTALGLLSGPPRLRSGARRGDRVVVGRNLGWSAAGLALLQAGIGVMEAGRAGGPGVATPAGLESVLSAHRAPRPDYPAVNRLAEAGVHALIDVSDGLLRDARRLASASGVVLDLQTDKVMALAGPELQCAAKTLDAPELVADWLFTGGEDHAFLACLPEDVEPPAGFAQIGTVRDSTVDCPPGVLVDSAPWAGSEGWVHFRR